MNYKRFLVLLIAMALIISMMNVTYADSPFTDIEKNWARKNIINVYEKGLMNGTSADKFSPDGSVNKYSALIAIARLMNAEKLADLDALAEEHKGMLDKYDVPLYARKEIAFCHDKNVILGEIDLVKFEEQPNANKLDISVYLGRAFGIEHDPLKPSVQLLFRDTEKIARPYRVYVEHMIKIGVVDGKGDAKGDFRPDDPVTRGMFAKMLDVASLEYDKEFGNANESSDSKDDDFTEYDDEITKPIDDDKDSVIEEDDFYSDEESITMEGIIDTITYTRDSKAKLILEVSSQKTSDLYIAKSLIKENIIIDGQLSNVYALRPGMQVEVKVINGEIKRISTIEITKAIDGRAIVKDLDLINAELRVDIVDEANRLIEERTFDVSSARIGDLSLNILNLDDIKLGQTITFFGEEDMEGVRIKTLIIQ